MKKLLLSKMRLNKGNNRQGSDSIFVSVSCFGYKKYFRNSSLVIFQLIQTNFDTIHWPMGPIDLLCSLHASVTWFFAFGTGERESRLRTCNFFLALSPDLDQIWSLHRETTFL